MTQEQAVQSQAANSGRKPPYLIALVGITLAYLLLECAFNARLLDVAGGQADSHAIEKVEFWGRIISGLAVALALCGTFVLPWLHHRKASWKKYIEMSTLIALPVIACVFHAEKLLIDTLVQHSSPYERRVATLVSLASHQLRRGEVELQGIDISPEILASPAGKTFVALFSPFVAHLPNGDAIILRNLDSLVRQSVTQLMGAPDQLFSGAFGSSLKSWGEVYKKYVHEVIIPYRAIPDEAEKAWQNFVDELKQRKTTPAKIPQWKHHDVGYSVREKGIPVPYDWKPSDKATFIQAFQKEAKKQLAAAVNKANPRMAQLPLEGFNDFETFLQHPVVQRQWREALQAPESAVLRNGMSARDFERQTYIPWYEHLVTEQKKALLAASAEFDSGGKHEALGKEAMRGLIVPPLALLFSLLGIIVHVCKTGLYSLRLLIPWLSLAIFINVALLGALMAAPLFLSNPISRTPVFCRVESRIGTGHPYTAKMLRWIIEGQTYIYPVNNWIRIHMLRGATFGTNENLNTAQIVAVPFVNKS